MAKRLLIFCSLFFYTFLISQSKLNSGFDAQEFLDVLHLEWAHQDSTDNYIPHDLPKNYTRVYRSPEVGLNNKFDLWIRDDSVGVICLRYTVGGESWLENFYSGMIKANGNIKLNDTTNFNYKLANTNDAYVHHGWLIGLSYLAPLITKQINQHYNKGIKNYIIVGHSQGAALAFLLRSYLEYLPETSIPKNITYKAYCSGAPKPGNLNYSYDFDFITQNGWAYRIVNTSDWVPQTPFTIQALSDINPINPFSKRNELMSNKFNKLLIKWYINHAVKDIDGAAKKTNRKYTKYLTKRTGFLIKKSLKNYGTPKVEKSNFYMPAGVPIILKTDSVYNQKFKYTNSNIFIHHLFESYIYLTKQLYLKD
jgi:hypothetical protein